VHDYGKNAGMGIQNDFLAKDHVPKMGFCQYSPVFTSCFYFVCTIMYELAMSLSVTQKVVNYEAN
jgi:hypothetical protein